MAEQMTGSCGQGKIRGVTSEHKLKCEERAANTKSRENQLLPSRASQSSGGERCTDTRVMADLTSTHLMQEVGEGGRQGRGQITEDLTQARVRA